MKDYSEKKAEEKLTPEYLRERKNQNLQILQNRIHELQIEKQKRERSRSQQEAR
jgi:hypothetical protein